jgi:hypothetical protein
MQQINEFSEFLRRYGILNTVTPKSGARRRKAFSTGLLIRFQRQNTGLFLKYSTILYLAKNAFQAELKMLPRLGNECFQGVIAPGNAF